MKEEMEKDMTPVLLEDLGMRFATENSTRRRIWGLYQCQYCGKEFETVVQSVKSGNTKSCGCQSKKYRNPHGLYKHPIYSFWNSMQTRCYNPKTIGYKNYGARGIQVCERWLDIENFIEDMYPTWEEGLSLDRIDTNGNYEIGNCRWTTQSIQQHNTRDIKSNNTSGFRGVYWHKNSNAWRSQIKINNKKIQLGSFHTALEAAKAYERYVRLNNLEHNFTPALTEEEIEEIYKDSK